MLEIKTDTMMKKYIPHTLITAMLLLASSCAKHDETPEGVNFASLPLARSMVRKTISVSPVPTPESETKNEEPEEISFNNKEGVVISRTRSYDMKQDIKNFMIFNPSTCLLYPGNFIVGSTVADGSFMPVAAQKTGRITWSTAELVPTIPGHYFKESITNPSLSDYNSTIQHWRSISKQEPGAISYFDLTEITSKKELLLNLGIGFDREKIEGRLDNKTIWKRMQTHVLLKFSQKLYTVSMDQPRGNILQEADISSMRGVMPVYVSDIHYGRAGYAMISSNHSYISLITALRMMLPDHDDIELDHKYKEILGQCVINEVIIGGRADDHNTIIDGGWEAFKQSIARGIDVNQALPIAMTLRYADDNSVARVLLSGSYPIRETHFIATTDHIDFKFEPLEMTPSTGAAPLYPLGTARIYGSIDAQLPDGTQFNILQISRDEALHITKGGTLHLAGKLPTATLTIPRLGETSMKEYMKQKVKITASFKCATRNESRDIDLGTSTNTRTIEDLIFDSVGLPLKIETYAADNHRHSCTITLRAGTEITRGGQTIIPLEHFEYTIR